MIDSSEQVITVLESYKRERRLIKDIFSWRERGEHRSAQDYYLSELQNL